VHAPSVEMGAMLRHRVPRSRRTADWCSTQVEEVAASDEPRTPDVRKPNARNSNRCQPER